MGRALRFERVCALVRACRDCQQVFKAYQYKGHGNERLVGGYHGWQLLPPEEAKYLVVGAWARFMSSRALMAKNRSRAVHGAEMHCPDVTHAIALGDHGPEAQEGGRSERKAHNIWWGALGFYLLHGRHFGGLGLAPGNYKLLPGHLSRGRTVSSTESWMWPIWVPVHGVWASTKTGHQNPAAERLYSSKVCYVIDPPLEAYKKAREKTGYPIYALGCKAQKIGLSDLPNFYGMPNDTGWWVHKTCLLTLQKNWSP